jgi:oxygen-dependent protoporphyrinogen oxidase
VHAGDRRFTARALILAVPAFVAARLLEPLDEELAHLCAAIPYVSSATITLGYPRTAVSHPLAGMGFIVPRGEPSTRLLAGSWVSSKWPARAPEGVALIRVFAGGRFDEDLLRDHDDAALVELAHRDLSTLLGIVGAPTVTRVYRWNDASPQYRVGHLAHVAAIEARRATHPGLWLTGSAYRGVGIPDTVADARATAAAVDLQLGQR